MPSAVLGLEEESPYSVQVQANNPSDFPGFEALINPTKQFSAFDMCALSLFHEQSDGLQTSCDEPLPDVGSLCLLTARRIQLTDSKLFAIICSRYGPPRRQFAESDQIVLRRRVLQVQIGRNGPARNEFCRYVR